MSANPKPQHRFWKMRESMPYFSQFYRLLDDDIEIGVRNDKQISIEISQQHRARGHKVPLLDDIWYDEFVNTPQIRLQTSYYPDFFESKNRILVSPRLFQLLDQPRGTLQGWKTETSWIGPNPPDRTYLWLSYIPRVPTFDIERSNAERTEYPNPEGGEPIIQLWPKGEMVLRDEMASPYGLFRAAEDRTIVLASDAVAEAVMRAGCTGIEFVEPESSSMNCGALYRRGPFEAELRLECVECRRANNMPVPEPEPPEDDDD